MIFLLNHLHLIIMACTASFKSEILERDCGDCMKSPLRSPLQSPLKSPFYAKSMHYTSGTSPHEFVMHFVNNYNNVDLNTPDAVAIMIREVKKVYNYNHRMLHTVFSTRKFSKMELLNLPKNHFNDVISWEKMIEVFTLGVILKEIADSRIDLELYYDVQDMLIYALKYADNWFNRIGGWGNFVKVYKKSIFL